MRVLASLVALSAASAQPTDRSLGAFVDCPVARSADAPCLWAGENGEIVNSKTLRDLLVQRHLVSFSDRDRFSRNLQTHMTYIEDVHTYAKSVGHEFSYHMGVNERHLTSSPRRRLSPQQLVDQEVKSARSRRLQAEASGSTTTSSNTVSSAGSSEYWNWCDSDNSFGYSVCSSVKSQQNCGSCWAFAAADAIETAVVIAENASAAVSLSPQQFLTCSNLETTQTFDYCWASSNGVDGATWMETEIKWESQNDGCNGGMTHGAFIDAAQNSWGLVTELTMPYDDSGSSSAASNNASSSCSVSANETAASITGWEQVVGADCTASSNCTILLRTALEKQPIAVAINSEDPFGDYAGGFYSCPNGGDLSSKDDVNHALVLVGYGTDASEGDYWILKNSYGSSWGASGFMKLVADSKVNCGLNIFPVIPTGASAGVAATTSVDSGGDKVFVGLSPSAWIAVAAVTTIFTIVTTAIGMLISQRRMKTIRKQNSAMYGRAPVNTQTLGQPGLQQPSAH
ncbi:Cysteine protease [Phytophthora megakarya]|uniref:Cysteine protease n=1 Tax=Phytophthora megakarya TaxID=4795 RepID=A0A225X505_9STRA|nr:Cysteine protease [Phytophthora megakarya]